MLCPSVVICLTSSLPLVVPSPPSTYYVCSRWGSGQPLLLPFPLVPSLHLVLLARSRLLSLLHHAKLLSSIQPGEILPGLGITSVWNSCPCLFGEISPNHGVLTTPLGCASVSCEISLFFTTFSFILITVFAHLCASACSLSILTGSCRESHCN